MTAVEQTPHPPTPGPSAPPPAQPRVVLVGAGAAAALGLTVWTRSGPVLALLFAVGLALGVVLVHSRFGFSSAWRRLVSVGQGGAVRAQMLMVSVACLLFAPLLAHHVGLRGVPLSPSLAPVGTALAVGAFLFGIGMQLGGSCASGTLFAVGSGQTVAALTLATFVVGSVLGSLSSSWWGRLPAHDAVSLTQWGGYPGALALSLGAAGLVVLLTHVIARSRLRPPPPMERPHVTRGTARVTRGAWPMAVGAVLLAGLDALTLYLSGGAWSITSAFSLWGARVLGLTGVHPQALAGLSAGVLHDRTSVMDLGIVIGALVASGLAGSWVWHARLPRGTVLGAVLGGLLMGYGSRLAAGCNIGAFLGGVASFSLHGWVWAAVALLGTVVGVRLRPLLGLGVPRPTDSSC